LVPEKIIGKSWENLHQASVFTTKYRRFMQFLPSSKPLCPGNSYGHGVSISPRFQCVKPFPWLGENDIKISYIYIYIHTYRDILSTIYTYTYIHYTYIYIYTGIYICHMHSLAIDYQHDLAPLLLLHAVCHVAMDLLPVRVSAFFFASLAATVEEIPSRYPLVMSK
jgi:hypothetical protein